jgi:hypothetical protein
MPGRRRQRGGRALPVARKRWAGSARGGARRDSRAAGDRGHRSAAGEGRRAGEEVASVELAGAPAVRCRAADRPSAGLVLGADPGVKTTTVRYAVPVPGSSAVLLLAFSTPLEALAEEMTALFDAVASSLRWIW